MDPFRGYLKMKIQEGKLDEFLSYVPSLVDIVKNTEPRALQYEAFVNKPKREVIWLETYTDNTGFDDHLANPELDELKMKAMPLQEPDADFIFLAPPTDATMKGLNQYGIYPSVLDPWPGTIRLDEAKDNGAFLQTFVTIDLTDIEAYRKISERIEALAANHPGVIFHRSYQMDDSRVAVYEAYADSDTFLDWAEVFAANAGDFNSLVKSITVEVFGDPTPECKAMLDNWGAIYYKRVAGYFRFA